jgi:hypothetical protein
MMRGTMVPVPHGNDSRAELLADSTQNRYCLDSSRCPMCRSSSADPGRNRAVTARALTCYAKMALSIGVSNHSKVPAYPPIAIDSGDLP